MRVSRLEIFGFKSFMERLSLPLSPGVTAVVGPNGCGKSNIVDALRWVLGETRARNLRGEVLEDVIFNGTDKLKPMGLAEVSIVLRSTKENFFADLTEAEAKGLGEVSELTIPEGNIINANQEVEGESTKGGKPRLTVIQGKMGEAGQQISEPETPPTPDETGSAMPSLLTRFAWLKSVNEVQVTRRLYRSGESEFFINRVQCRLKDIKDLFRATGIGARSHTIVAQGEISKIISAKPEERRLVIEEAAGVLGFREKIATTTRKLEETELNISRLDDIITEVSRQVSNLKRQATRARNRKELKGRLKDIETILFAHRHQELKALRDSHERSREALSADEENALAALHKAKAEEESVKNVLMTGDVECDSLRTKIDSLREELHNRERTESESRLKDQEISLLTAAANEELLKIHAELPGYQSRVSDLNLIEEEVQRKTSELQGKIKALGVDALEQQILALNEEILGNRDRRVALETEISTIDKASAMAPKASSDDLLANMRFSDRVKNAVMAVLGTRAGFVLSETPHRQATSEYAGYVKAGSAIASDRLNIPFSRLLDLIEFSDRAQYVGNRIFGSVYLADSLDLALDHFKADPKSSITLVTPAGDIITEYSVAYSNSSAEEKAAALSGLAEKLDRELGFERELAGRKAKLQEELEQLVKQRSALYAELNKLLADHELEKRVTVELAGEADKLKRREVELKTKLARLKEELDRVRTFSTDRDWDRERLLKEELQKAENEFETRDTARRGSLANLSGVSNLVHQARESLDDIRERLSAEQLELQKISLEEGSLREKILTHYGEELIEVVANHESVSVPEEDLASQTEEAIRIKARLAREEEVDPESIARFDEESARLENLETQRKDLAEAAVILKRTILHLQETSEKRFLSVFAAVKRNFGELIPRLFGGGRGSIDLVNPEKPLESGVEISARPPGKKLKSIDLMSGGEKALCATALMFAMFMERPSPLCVLDEVDAPLDEANLLRFLAMIKEMSLRTQFLLITHSKQSMSLADNLIGVTMHEPGASKILSVSLEEAAQVQVA